MQRDAKTVDEEGLGNEQTTDQEITQVVVRMYSGNDNNNTVVPGALQFGSGVYLCGQE